MASKRSVPARPAPTAPPVGSILKTLKISNGSASNGKSRSTFYLEERSKKNPPPRPPPPKVLPQYIQRSSSLERPHPPHNVRSTVSYHGALPPPPTSGSGRPHAPQHKPKVNEDLAALIDLFSSPPPSSSTSSSPTLTHHSGSDGFSVNSLTMEEDFDPFSPRSLASKQKDAVHRLNESSVLTQFQPDSKLQHQYALLYGPRSSKPVGPSPVAPPKARKPTVIRSGTAPQVSNSNHGSSGSGGFHPPVAAKPTNLSPWPSGAAKQAKQRESSPPEPAVPPPKPPELEELTLDDAPPALPPRRPHSEEPFNTEEPHAIVLFDYEKTHPDDLGCAAGELVYLVTKVNEDWYMCKKKQCASSEEGMIPTTFLDILVPVKQSASRAVTPNPPSFGVPATALYEFEGQIEGDLSFPEGATIIVEARINDDWLFGSFAGKRGQFPTTFVTEINVALPQHAP